MTIKRLDEITGRIFRKIFGTALYLFGFVYCIFHVPKCCGWGAFGVVIAGIVCVFVGIAICLYEEIFNNGTSSRS